MPVLTVEDIILSKLYALMAGRPRPKDIDDLQSIFQAIGWDEMDIPYLAGQMKRQALVVPATAKPFLPAALIALSQDVSRSLKKSKSAEVIKGTVIH